MQTMDYEDSHIEKRNRGMRQLWCRISVAPNGSYLGQIVQEGVELLPAIGTRWQRPSVAMLIPVQERKFCVSNPS
jgi:hypothetical protein